HRGLGSSFAVVTASLADGKRQDFQRMATAVDTLVVLMAAGKLREVSEVLIEAGRCPDEPAAVIGSATTNEQATVTARLDGIADTSARVGIEAPATLVVGPVAALAEKLSWFRARLPHLAEAMSTPASR